MNFEELKITVSGQPDTLGARWFNPDKAIAQILMTHGAGAPMQHPFMYNTARLMAQRGFAVLQYNFPYMERGSKRPDPQKKTVASILDVIKFQQGLSGLPLFIGGKSYGGRMCSWAVHENPDLSVSGIIYWGFPLHAPGKPSADRADHLADIQIPMLFLQGTRDALAKLDLLTPVVKKTKSGELYIVEDGDHSFKVPARAGKSQEDVLEELADKVSHWILQVNAVA